MQSPPPFHGYEQNMRPQKPKTNGLVILFAILGVLLICCGLPLGFFGYFGYKGFKGAMEMGGCLVNVEAMQRALTRYEQDHKGKLPPAATWQAELGPYFKFDKDMDGAPMKLWKAGGEWSCEEGNTKTGFMFNEALSEKVASEVVKSDPHAIAIFETTTVAFNQSGKLTPTPIEKSPKIIGGMIDEHRGWMLIGADGTSIFSWDREGKITSYDMGTSKRKRKSGFNFKVDTNSSEDNNSN